MSDIAIVGGGINGLLSALKLADCGAEVVVLERGECAGEASWAGGGILSPLYPWRYDDAVTALASVAEPAWPALAERLRGESGIDPQYSPHGIAYLRVAEIEQVRAWQARTGRQLEIIDTGELPDRPAALTAEAAPAVWMPHHGSIRTPRIGQALRALLKRHPRVTLREYCPVTAITCQHERVTGLETTAGRIAAERVVIAGGPWTQPLLAPLGIELPIQPVRGQMLLFEAPAGTLDRVVLMGGHYLIPRREGRILAGSTFEQSGFDSSVTPDARRLLHERALAMAPGLAEVPIVAHWAGLRPGSPDSIPFVGETALPGLWLNAGHGGNGVVLAPATAQLLGELMSGTAPCVDPIPYRCDVAAIAARRGE